MSSSLPPELFDLIVDHLCDKPIALRACCLVSKSWIHRTRKHLFAYVEFDGFTPCIQSWMRAFPDPSNSPAHYTRSLSTRGFKSVTTAAMDARAWVRSFRHLVHLAVATHGAQDESRVSLAQLKRLSPTLRSLHLCHYRIPLPEIIDLICSFPLLKDLSLIYLWDECDTDGWNVPPSPKFTGSLDLTGEVNTIARGLLELPGGLHFSEIKVTCADYHAESVMDLVSGCSDTLEYLYINFDFALREFRPVSTVDKYLTTTCWIQAIPCPYSTSLRSRNSETWSFGLACKAFNGFQRRSKPLDSTPFGRSASPHMTPSTRLRI